MVTLQITSLTTSFHSLDNTFAAMETANQHAAGPLDWTSDPWHCLCAQDWEGTEFKIRPPHTEE